MQDNVESSGLYRFAPVVLEGGQKHLKTACTLPGYGQGDRGSKVSDVKPHGDITKRMKTTVIIFFVSFYFYLVFFFPPLSQRGLDHFGLVFGLLLVRAV